MNVKISEKSSVTLGFLIAVVGGAVPLVMLFPKVEAQADAQKEIKTSLVVLFEKYNNSNTQILERLARIEALLEDKDTKKGR